MDVEQLEIGDNVTIDEGVSLSGHSFKDGRLQISKVRSSWRARSRAFLPNIQERMNSLVPKSYQLELAHHIVLLYQAYKLYLPVKGNSKVLRKRVFPRSTCLCAAGQNWVQLKTGAILPRVTWIWDTWWCHFKVFAEDRWWVKKDSDQVQWKDSSIPGGTSGKIARQESPIVGSGISAGSLALLMSSDTSQGWPLSDARALSLAVALHLIDQWKTCEILNK